VSDANVQGAIEVDDSIAPDFAPKPVAVDDFARVLHQQKQDLERLWWKADDAPVAAQFTAGGVEFEDTEAESAGGGSWRRAHCSEYMGGGRKDAPSALLTTRAKCLWLKSFADNEKISW
jgi:hypothetical protein